MDADIHNIYKQLCDRYPLTLHRSVDIRPQWTMEFPVLRGTSALGNFEMFFDGVSFAFYIGQNGKLLYHWHLQNPEDAKRTVIDFMEGRLQKTLS